MSYRHDDDPSEVDLFGVFDADTLQPLDKRPKAFAGCCCPCHRAEMHHIISCCGPGGKNGDGWSRRRT